MSIKHFDDKTLEEEIKNSKLPLLIDFYADWCGPCRRMAPLFEEISKEYEGKIVFGKLDVDKNPKITAKYEIRSIPSLLYFDKGELKDSNVGYAGKEELKKFIESF